MRRGVCFSILLGLAIEGAPGVSLARAEDLTQAWTAALAADQRLASRQESSAAAGSELEAARRERLPKVTTTNPYVFLNNTPAAHVDKSLSPRVGGPGTLPADETANFLPKNFLFSNTAVNVPVYTGGRISRTVESAGATLNSSRFDERRTALDTKLEVARAYIEVLRTRRLLEVARSNVTSLESHVRDVTDRLNQGVASRNDLLSTQVSLDNARQRLIQAENGLDLAQSTYNSVLYRPLTAPVVLDELPTGPPRLDLGALAAKAVASRPEFQGLDEDVIRATTEAALGLRPELASLSESARALGTQAAATRSATLPQVSISGGNLVLTSPYLTKQDFLYVYFNVQWQLYDGGVAKRKSQALQHRELATLRLRCDTARQVALQVRQGWLQLHETRSRITVALSSLRSAEENLKVTLDRYSKGVGTNTEVLDAETLRLQSFNNYFNATYDAALADFQLHRAVGDL